jgi:hypothetical protein
MIDHVVRKEGTYYIHARAHTLSLVNRRLHLEIRVTYYPHTRFIITIYDPTDIPTFCGYLSRRPLDGIKHLTLRQPKVFKPGRAMYWLVAALALAGLDPCRMTFDRRQGGGNWCYGPSYVEWLLQLSCQALREVREEGVVGLGVLLPRPRVGNNGATVCSRKTIRFCLLMLLRNGEVSEREM